MLLLLFVACYTTNENKILPFFNYIHESTTPTLTHGCTNIKRLQPVQNSDARVVLENYSCRPAGDLFKLHWFPVQSRISFKIARLT